MTPLLSEAGSQRAAQRSNRSFPVRGHCFCFSSSQIIGLPASLSHSRVSVLTCSCFGDGFGSGLTTSRNVFGLWTSYPCWLQQEGFETKSYCQRLGVREEMLP